MNALFYACRGDGGVPMAELEQAAGHWEAILLAHPHDVAALELASFVYFYLGDAASVRDSVTR